jgi:hypothetical protein
VELYFVLRLPGLERSAEVIPETEQARIQHLREPTDVVRARFVKKRRCRGSILVFSLWAIAIPVEKFERDQSIEEIVGSARMKIERCTELWCRHRSVPEGGKQLQLHCREQHLGSPKGGGGLHDVARIELVFHRLSSSM